MRKFMTNPSQRDVICNAVCECLPDSLFFYVTTAARQFLFFTIYIKYTMIIRVQHQNMVRDVRQLLYDPRM